MRKLAVIFLWLALLPGVVFGQDSTATLGDTPFGQVGTLEAADFRALAVTADGDRLLVADAENKQVRVYDFTDPATPALLASLDVSGTPVLLAGGEDYGLVAVATQDDTDSVEAIAPALPGTPYLSGANFISIPKNPRVLALSPDQRWGIVVSESGYTLMQINGPNEITSSPPVDETIIDAALSNTTAYLLRGKVLETAPLGSLRAMQAAQVLGLDGTPSALALNADGSTGVVVLDGTRLLFFDPRTLEQTREFSLAGNPVTSIHFLNKDGIEYLLVTQEGSGAIAVLDTGASQQVTALSSTQSLQNPIRALTIFQKYLIVTDGTTISILSA